MLIKPEVQRFAKIKVLGIGGGGSNAINTMINHHKIQGVDFIAVNTDLQALQANGAPIKIQIGKDLTKGLGSGADPEVGKKAAEESVEEIQKALEGSDMVFLTCGKGKGTGTGATPIIAQLAKNLGILTVAVVTKPFHFEGRRRMEQAEVGISELKDKVDTLITIPNQKLLEAVERRVSILDAFKMADDILGQGVQGISDLIVMPGLINVDFADVKTIMIDAGSALMGIGRAQGEDKAANAAKMAISSPLLEVSINGAKGILFNIVGGPDLSMFEVDEAARIISEAADPEANIIFGASIDEAMAEKIKVTVIATGFDADLQRVVKKAEEEAEDKKTPRPGEEGEVDEYDIPAFMRQ